MPFLDERFVELAARWLGEADALLFGRRPYVNFARDWPNITDPDDPFTEKMNGLPKQVTSITLETADWNPTTILSGDVSARVAASKEQPGREVQIHGSAQLAQSLLAAGLIDTMRPVIGHGRRPFPLDGVPVGLPLQYIETTPTGLAIHVYEVANAPVFGAYGPDA